MKVLADMHHGGLYYSLKLLFEDRLGWDLYRPIGMEWYKLGFWNYSTDLDVVRQYLEPKNDDDDLGDHWLCSDRDFNWTQMALTFDQFKKKKIDYVVASVFPHGSAYKRLIELFMPEAKLIRQIGNWDEEADFRDCQNYMISTGQFQLPSGINTVCYHQEFSLKEWQYQGPGDPRKIRTFINCFPTTEDAHLWPIYKKALPEFKFFMHGIGGEEGNVYPQARLRQMYQDTGFV